MREADLNSIREMLRMQADDPRDYSEWVDISARLLEEVEACKAKQSAQSLVTIEPPNLGVSDGALRELLDLAMQWGSSERMLLVIMELMEWRARAAKARGE